MPLDTALSSNGATFINTNVVVDVGPDLYANNIYYRTLKGGAGPTNYGYRSGGFTGSIYQNVIERFPFSLAITNATDVGDLSSIISYSSGQSSATYGYISGGSYGPSPTSNVIERFPFSLAITNSSDVGDLTFVRYGNMGVESGTYGYTYMGYDPSIPATYNVIERFPFALSITNSTDVGDTLTSDYTINEGTCSANYGYINGSLYTSPLIYTQIERFPFALSIVDSVFVGTLTVSRFSGAGQESDDYGYTSGGKALGAPGVVYNIIDRFPFASSITNASDVGDLTAAKFSVTGTSSTTYGYTSGGSTLAPGTPRINVIDRFPFALAITNATDVGDLTATLSDSIGQQY